MTAARVRWSAVALGAAVLVVYAVADREGRGLSVLAASVVVTVAAAVKFARSDRAARPVLGLLVAGFTLLVAINALWVVEVAFRDQPTSPQPWANLGMFSAYVLLLAAAIVAIAPTIRRDWGGMLDAAIVGVGSSMALWLTVIGPALTRGVGYDAQRSYIFTLMMVLGAMIGVMAGAWASKAVAREARPALAYFITAVVCALAGNVLSVVLADPVTGANSAWPGVAWPLAYAAAFAGITHPASKGAFRVGSQGTTRLTKVRMGLIGVALTGIPFIAIIRHAAGADVDWFAGVLAQYAISVMVTLRFSQVAQAHRRTEGQLTALADLDHLTGLANRRAVSAHLAALARRVREGDADGVVVAFMDLNDFKDVNDTHGHLVGDELLIAIAGRLAASVRFDSADLVGRLGGDEFIVVFEGDPVTIAEAARARVAGLFARPFQLSVGALTITTSIGLATAHRGDDASVDELLTDADHAMYDHKRTASS